MFCRTNRSILAPNSALSSVHRICSPANPPINVEAVVMVRFNFKAPSSISCFAFICFSNFSFNPASVALQPSNRISAAANFELASSNSHAAMASASIEAVCLEE